MICQVLKFWSLQVRLQALGLILIIGHFKLYTALLPFKLTETI